MRLMRGVIAFTVLSLVVIVGATLIACGAIDLEKE